jgi:hypothetical protein
MSDTFSKIEVIIGVARRRRFQPSWSWPCRVYEDATREALIVLWEASDRIELCEEVGDGVKGLDAVMGLRQNPWRGDCPPE